MGKRLVLSETALNPTEFRLPCPYLVIRFFVGSPTIDLLIILFDSK